MVTGSACGPPAQWHHAATWIWTKGSWLNMTCSSWAFLGTPLVSRKRAKAFIARVTAGEGRDALLAALGLSLSIWAAVSQGWCAAAISSASIRVSQRNNNNPPTPRHPTPKTPFPPTPVCPPLTLTAGRQVERQISRLVSEKRKCITPSGYLRQSAG